MSGRGRLTTSEPNGEGLLLLDDAGVWCWRPTCRALPKSEAKTLVTLPCAVLLELHEAWKMEVGADTWGACMVRQE